MNVRPITCINRRGLVWSAIHVTQTKRSKIWIIFISIPDRGWSNRCRRAHTRPYKFVDLLVFLGEGVCAIYPAILIFYIIYDVNRPPTPFRSTLKMKYLYLFWFGIDKGLYNNVKTQKLQSSSIYQWPFQTMHNISTGIIISFKNFS